MRVLLPSPTERSTNWPSDSEYFLQIVAFQLSVLEFVSANYSTFLYNVRILTIVWIMVPSVHKRDEAFTVVTNQKRIPCKDHRMNASSSIAAPVWNLLNKFLSLVITINEEAVPIQRQTVKEVSTTSTIEPYRKSARPRGLVLFSATHQLDSEIQYANR